MALMCKEPIDQFVCHLWQKAVSCEFDQVDEAIQDQLIEKCRDPELPQKFLDKAQEGTLTVLQDVARVHESVKLQMQSLETSCKDNQVNEVQPVDPKHKKKQKEKEEKKWKTKRCTARGASEVL